MAASKSYLLRFPIIDIFIIVVAYYIISQNIIGTEAIIIFCAIG